MQKQDNSIKATIDWAGPHRRLLSSNWAILITTLLIVFVTRLPFLGAGYGEHGDARLIITAARSIAWTGHYTISRVPGYPLLEFLYALLWKTGPWICNGLSALMCGLAAGYYILILRCLNCSHSFLVGLSLAFVPVMYISSVSSIDFTWGIAFAMASFYYFLSGHIVLPGILLGLAIGTRLPWSAMVIPYVYYLYDPSSISASIRKIFRFVIPSAFLGLLAFLPSYLAYGFQFFNYEPFDVSLEWTIRTATTEVWGVLGLILLLAALPAIFIERLRKRSIRLITEPIPGKIKVFGYLVALIYLAVFFKMPIKGAYLTPVIPLILIALARLLPRKSAIVLFIGLFIAPFFISLSRYAIDQQSLSETELTFAPGGKQVIIDVLHGPILIDYLHRRADLELTEETIRMADSYDKHVVIAAGWNWQPYLRAHFMTDTNKADLQNLFSHDCVRLFKPFTVGKVEYYNFLDRRQLIDYRSMNVPVFVMPNQEIENIRWNNTDPLLYGAKPISLPGR